MKAWMVERWGKEKRKSGFGTPREVAVLIKTYGPFETQEEADEAAKLAMEKIIEENLAEDVAVLRVDAYCGVDCDDNCIHRRRP